MILAQQEVAHQVKLVVQLAMENLGAVPSKMQIVVQIIFIAVLKVILVI
jgi:hypothetical protein